MNLKKHMTAMVIAGALGVTGVLTQQQVATADAATVGGVVVTNSNVSVRRSPASTSATTGQVLKTGTAWKVIRVTRDANGATWYDLGNNAWVAAATVRDRGVVQAPTTSSRTAQVQSVINLAKQQLGKPYVWGAKGPSAFDCSGLMYYVFKNALGKNIGGWTVAQESTGKVVSVGSLQAGDLIFWGSRGNTYHVGLYIGNGQFIDAPAPGQTVRISKISGYFMPSFGLRVL